MSRWILPVLVAAAIPHAQAQLFQRLFNPTIQVELTHPPGLGLKVQRVAFAPSSNDASEDLVAACISELVANGTIDIVDRNTTQKVLAEQKLSVSGLVDSDQVVELGKLMGSPVLLTVKVNSSSIRQDRSKKTHENKDKDGKVTSTTYTYISRTQMDFTASVQAVDTATGKIYSSRRLVFSPHQEKSDSSGYPEYPSETAVKEEAIKQARVEVIRMLLPWKEQRGLIFYNDKDYGMKEAHALLKVKDYPGALNRAEASLAQAKADPKVKTKYLGRTHYNVGMCKFILGDYDGASALLKAASATDPDNGIFLESIRDCEKAIALREEMAKVDSRSPGLSKAAQGPAASDVEARLEKLLGLFKKGLITEAEYQQKKAELMKEL